MVKKLITGFIFLCAVLLTAAGFATGEEGQPHTLRLIPAQDASCLTDGHIAYYACTGCERLFSDEKGEEELLPESTVIKAAGRHTPQTVLKRATRKTDGYSKKVCAVCAQVLGKTVIPAASDMSISSSLVTYNGKVRTPSVSVKTATGKKISRKYYTVTKPARMKDPGRYKLTVSFRDRYKGGKSFYFTIKTPSPEIKSLSADDGTATLHWKTVSVANGYQLYMADSRNGTYRKLKTLKADTLTVKKLENGKRYYFKVRAYHTAADGRHCYSDFSPVKGLKIKKAVKITLERQEVTLTAGTGIRLLYKTYPAKVTVRFRSSDRAVVRVTAKGKVTAENPGKAVITAYFTYKDKKYRAKCSVTVCGRYSYDMNGEKYAVIDPDSYSEDERYLLVVDRTRRVEESYMPDIVSLLPGWGFDQELERHVAPHYEDMFYAARRDGITLTPYSAFRYYSGQKRNYLGRIDLWRSYGYSKQEAIERTVEVIMAPGGSEHNLGLAVDINGTDYDFDQTAAYDWLCANAHKYGFILRYPAGKSHITGVVCEPWHWRYVGVKAAGEMYGTDLCLEEYLDKKGIAY